MVKIFVELRYFQYAKGEFHAQLDMQMVRLMLNSTIFCTITVQLSAKIFSVKLKLTKISNFSTVVLTKIKSRKNYFTITN
jgi:hypothetical protein